MIWEPFVLALFLGLIVSAGLYFAYLWPSVEPEAEPVAAAADSSTPEPEPAADEPPAADLPADKADEPAAEEAKPADEPSPPS